MEASMLKHFAACLLGLAALFAALTPATAEKRVALVIGNSTSRLCGIRATTLPTLPPSCAGSASTWLRGSIFRSATWKSGFEPSPKR
jgi:hypothetical protein